MARLFISHSSWNNDKAVEVRDWLAKNGWEDVFLDLDPERGIVAGQRWKEALQKAAYRCEAVLGLVSKEWLASGWCKSEIDAARLMGKKVIVALVNADKSAVPPDLTDEQFVDLTGDPQAYPRLKEGLKRAGLDPTTFPFPAGRRPYPGFAYLEEQDAAVFFGRDAQIVRGLDEIRRLARAGVTRMLVILGASGSGKSSFLRAGLWSRLKRDDLAWLPLPIVRPECAAMTGKDGVAQALYQTVSDPRFADGIRQRSLPRSRADIQDFVVSTDGGLANLLVALREIAAGFAVEDATPPTTLIAIDQGEELFNEEGRGEAKRFIDILTKTLAADPRTMAILVMRSDAFALVQSDPALAALPKDTFTLDMMLEGSFRQVIEGPARLVEPPLAIDPQLTDALLRDISGQDALPLLAFTLAHLYDNTLADNALMLAGYDKLGRVKGVIDNTVAQAFAEAADKGEAPKTKEEQFKLARSAFIPHLAQVNPAGQFVRRVSPRDKIPAEARLLIDRFAEKRLLVRDRRQDAEVVEVAHEALLRQPPFSDWLSEDREFLLWRDRLTQARTAFEADERALLAGRELAIARSYMQTRAEREFEPADLAFIRDSVAADDKRRAEEAEEQRKREAAEKEEQERRLRDAERIAGEQTKAAAAQKRTTQVMFVGLVIAALIAAAAFWQYREAKKATELATQQSQIAQSRELAVSATSQLSFDPELSMLLARAAAERAPTLESESALRVALLKSLVRVKIEGDGGGLWSTVYTPDGSRLLLAGEDNMVRIANASSGNAIGKLSGHSARVYDVAVSPNGAHALTASDDGTIRLWNLATATEIAQIPMHREVIAHAAFSPDSRLAVLASDGNTARVWDTTTGMAVSELRGHKGPVTSAAFSPDGTWLITGSDDTTARVWNARTGETVAVLPGSTAVTQVLFSPDGKLAATVTPDQLSVHLWKAGSWDPASNVNTDFSIVSAVFSPDGSRLALVESLGNRIHVWDARTGSKLADCVGHTGRIFSAAFSPDSMRLVTGSEDKTARVWDAATGSTILELRGHRDIVTNAQFNPDGTQVATSSLDGTARIWEADSISDSRELKLAGRVERAGFSPDGALVWIIGSHGGAIFSAADANLRLEVPRHPDTIADVAFSPNQRSFATASRDGFVRIWLWPDGTQVAKLAGYHAAFSANGTLLLTSTGDGHTLLWDVEKKSAITTLNGRADEAGAAAFNLDGERVVTVNEDTAIMWNAQTGERMSSLHATKDYGVTAAAFSRDGRLVVTSSADKIVRLWDAATARLLREMKGHTDAVIGAWFSADGKLVASVGQDQTARVWEAASGHQLTELRGDRDNWEMLSFNPSGTLILTGGGHNPITLWDTRTGTKLVEFGTEASIAMFSPDGKQILLARDGSARLYRCVECGNVGELVLLAQARATRDLTADERRAFMHER
jgi:WD40 repeat protein